MSDVATALLQLIGRTEPAADPALAAVKLTRASLDALILRLGQSIDAKVTAQLAGGLTQFTAGGESFVLKLETPLPVNTAVTLKITPTPTGQPAVTVTVQPQPAVAQPAPPAPQALPPLPPPPAATTAPPPPVPSAAQPAPPAPPPPGASPAAAMPATPSVSPAAPALPTPTQAQPPIPAAQAPATPALQAAPAAPPPVPHAPVQQAAAAMVPAVATPTLPSAPAPVMQAPPTALAPAAPAQPVPTAVPPLNQPTTPAAVSTPPAPVAVSTQPAIAQLSPSAPALPASNSPTTSSPTPSPISQPAATTLPTPVVASGPAPVGAPQLVSAPALPTPAPQAAAPTSLAPPTVVPPMLAAPISTPRPAPPPASPPLAQILADPVQAAARQDSVLPLIARLATLAAPTAAALPRPALEAIAMLLGTRLDLNRAPPDGKSLRDAVLRTGIITEPGTRTPTDAKSALLQLRSALSGFLGGEVEAIAPVTRRPPPPLKGEPVRAPSTQPAPPLAEEPVETARQLLGHADAALSRTKLLQLASNPADAARPNAVAPAAEFRVEVPMQLGAETGILQLLVERDGKHKRSPAERGWRMRFALNFAATGEVGAEVALLGRSANVSLWAAEPATAEALEAMLPDLAPALARHGLDVASVRVRRGAPQPAARAPGQLLDSAR